MALFSRRGQDGCRSFASCREVPPLFCFLFLFVRSSLFLYSCQTAKKKMGDDGEKASFLPRPVALPRIEDAADLLCTQEGRKIAPRSIYYVPRVTLCACVLWAVCALPGRPEKVQVGPRQSERLSRRPLYLAGCVSQTLVIRRRDTRKNPRRRRLRYVQTEQCDQCFSPWSTSLASIDCTLDDIGARFLCRLCIQRLPMCRPSL